MTGLILTAILVIGGLSYLALANGRRLWSAPPQPAVVRTRDIPPIDAQAPTDTETATFAQG